MYTRPVDMLEEVKAMPDATGAIVLLAATFVFQTLTAIVTLHNVWVRYEGVEVYPLQALLPDLAIYMFLRCAAFFIFWFILFMIFWFILYMLGTRAEGFPVFSAAGYVLSSQLAPFMVIALVQCVSSLLAGEIVVASEKGLYLRLMWTAAHTYRLDAASRRLGLPLKPIIEAAEYFGTVWNVVLVVLMFRISGDLNWRRTAIGAAIAIATSWLIATIFRATGVL